MNSLVVTRSEAEDNPLFTNVIKKLEDVKITFQPRAFEYTSPQDFIYYCIDNDRITFAMKVLFYSNNFKIVDIHYDNQLTLLLSFVNFRSLIVKNYQHLIQTGVKVKILWRSQLCDAEINSFAKLANIMEDEVSEFEFTIQNKDSVYGKKIEITKPHPFHNHLEKSLSFVNY